MFDELTTLGLATLTDVPNISFIGGFVPTPGDGFQIMTFRSRSGSFTTINGLDVGGGRALQVNYNATNVTLVTPP